jgi:hypothetical protein
MYIRHRHTQKTQPPHAAKKWRGKESMGLYNVRISISNKTPQTINEKEKPPNTTNN